MNKIIHGSIRRKYYSYFFLSIYLSVYLFSKNLRKTSLQQYLTRGLTLVASPGLHVRTSCVTEVLAMSHEGTGGPLYGVAAEELKVILFSWVGPAPEEHSQLSSEGFTPGLWAHIHIPALEAKQDPVRPPWVQKPFHVPVS